MLSSQPGFPTNSNHMQHGHGNGIQGVSQGMPPQGYSQDGPPQHQMLLQPNPGQPTPQMHFPQGLMLGGNGQVPMLQPHMHGGMPPQPQVHGAPQHPHHPPHAEVTPTSTTRKPWHSPEDLPTRQYIAEQIVSLLQQRRPNASEDWQQKLPNMGRRLEDALYLKANSLEEYRDINTLKHRLQQLAQQMNSKNTPQNRQPPGAMSQPQTNPPMPQQQPGNMGQQQPMSGPGPSPQLQGMPVQSGAMPQHQYQHPQQMYPQYPQAYYPQYSQPTPSQPYAQANQNGALNQQGGPANGPQYSQYPQQAPSMHPMAAANHSAPQSASQQAPLVPPSQQFSQHPLQPQGMPHMAQHGQQAQTSRTLAAVSSQYPSGPPVQRSGQAPSGGQMMGHGMSAIEGMPSNSGPSDHQHQQPQYAEHNVSHMRGQGEGHSMEHPNDMSQLHRQHFPMQQPPGQHPMHMHQMPPMPQMMHAPSPQMQMQHGQIPPAQMQGGNQPGHLPVGHMQQGHLLPGQMNHSHMPQASVPQGQHMPQGHLPPGQFPSGHSQTGQHQPLHPQQGYAPPGSMQTGTLPQGHISNQQVPTQAVQGGMQQMRVGPQQPGPGQQAGPTDDAASRRASQSQHSEEHRRQVLKQQQQRLLLLRHASKCPHENGRCPVTPHCASMKNLWKHIMGCKDQECKVPHCVSSRYVLSHYSKCKDVNCPVCGPVREAIRRNYQKSQQIIDMSSKPSTAAPPEREPAEKRPRPVAAPAEKAVVQMPAEKRPRIVPEPPPKPAPRTTNLLDPISCALYSFSNDQIKAHIQNIQEGLRLSASGIKDICIPLIDELFKVPHAYSVFGAPVDPVAFNLPDYFDIIKAPMDLGTVRRRLDMNGYRDIQNFAFDVRLTFNNAMRYNPKNSDVHLLAKQLLKDFDTRFARVVHKIEADMEEKRSNSEACLVCGEISLKFEPPVYYCNGKCGGQRIRRNSYYYSAGNNAYHWCTLCFQELRENQLIQLPDCTITKAELAKNKKKHSEESEEPWVQCDSCERWVHQICGLFNGRRNLGDSTGYMCPTCLMERRKLGGQEGFVSSTTKKMQAIDLPRTTLSDFIERRISEKLESAYHDTAFKLNQTYEEVEKCPPLTLRQVSCFDKNQPTREAMYERYKSKGYPSEFPCRTKCLILFQNIDGQDTLLFGMYVYEYGHNCPQPNQRRCYISYLDSVHYFRPKQYRTVVYHEILVAYLEYMKARGFHTAHIWACPPLKGDDYILYCHPADQKTPKDDKLRKWYVDMLDACKERGIMVEVTDIFSEYLSDPSYDATVLPYFEGDYWVSEAEVIIKELGKPSSSAVSDSVIDDSDFTDKSKRKSSTRKGRKGPVATAATLLKVDRDPVMAKLASIIEPMKEAFFVCRMHPKEFAMNYAAKLQNEISAASSTQSAATEKKREEEMQNEALQGNDLSIRSEVNPSSDEINSFEAANADRSSAEANENSMDTGVIESKDDDADKRTSMRDTWRIGTSEESKHAKAWHLAEHDSIRQQIKDELMKIKREKYAGTPPSDELLRQIEEEAKRHENIMYLHAKSFEEYSNAANLRQRLDQIEYYLKDLNSSASKQPTSLPEESKPAKSWHSAEHNGTREEILKHIVDLLRNKASNVTDEWMRDLPVKAKRLEVNLYSMAQSFDEYSNKNTLKARLQQLAKSMHTKAKDGDSISSPNPVTVPAEIKEPVLKQEKKLEPSIHDNGLPRFKDDTEDIDDVQENEHFDTRQSFLNLCQGNHYQFDQLRRAKHTSMMVLYHLHNPDAPKFVPSCVNCHKDILIGNRHHCESCDVDLCDDCFAIQTQGAPLF